MSKGPTKRCFRQTCSRKAKVLHECKFCDFTVRSCNFHHERAFGTVQQHVIAEHPREYRAAKAAFERPPAAAPQATHDVQYGNTFDLGAGVLVPSVRKP